MTRIENQEKVIQVFGRWPAFHDAEIHRLIERVETDGPTLELSIHAAGHLVAMRFTRVAGEGLSGFNEQNVIFEMKIAQLSPAANEGRHFRVDISSSYGLAGTFDCDRAIVTSVTPLGAAV